ncbi:c-type cytochrome [Candidatus Nitrospira bockiana]
MTKRGARTAVVAVVVTVSVAAAWVSSSAEGGRVRPGALIYEEHCARCHGLSGRGDGPDAATLIVPPANLQSLRSRSKSDFELLTTIAYGVAYSPMHGWRGRLTDDEMLEVIAYIRTMAPFYPAL